MRDDPAHPGGWVWLLVIAGGAAGLAWEVLWQTRAALALGVSAEGTALVLALTMGGMTAGALLAGSALRGRRVARPLRVYAAMELAIGLFGLASPAILAWTAARPVLGVVAAIVPPSLAMGATVPVLGLVARRHGTQPGLLYGANTLGAAAGALLLAFVALPSLGVLGATRAVAALDVLVAALAWSAAPAVGARPSAAAPTWAPLPFPAAAALVFSTGYATFALEVAWFRALRSVFLDTAGTFAILLAAVLLPLAGASALAARARRIGPWVAAAGVAVSLTTPLVERMGGISRAWLLSIEGSWLVQTLAVIGPAMLLLGVALPWVLDREHDPRRWGALYALNALGSMAGALTAAWIWLPALGFARTAGAVGAGLLAIAVVATRGRERMASLAALAGCAALGLTVDSGVGRTRALGAAPGATLVAHREDPDHTVSVVDTDDGRRLLIDGFEAAADRDGADYMVWMGRLPALLHPDPRRALVICFGTGQTANAARREVPEVDVAEVSQAVLDLAWAFPVNEGVLDAPGVTARRVDGRAWLRTTEATYDIVTLEPMPPTFAGVNALYSREFYALVASRLRPGGIVAQWLPVHLTDPARAAAIAATLADVFPDAALWVHPGSGTGILLGRAPGGPAGPLGAAWPGLLRERPGRTLSAEAVVAGLALDPGGVARLAAVGEVVTDDNQLLTYGADPRSLTEDSTTALANAALIELARRGAPIALPPAQRRGAVGFTALSAALIALGAWAFARSDPRDPAPDRRA